MNTTQIVGVVIAALIVIGGGAFFMMNGSYSMSDTATTTGETTDSTPKMADGTFRGSWNDLAARGGNYTCDINSAGANDTTTGTVAVSGQKLRGDFTSVTTAGTVESHMLRLADTVYVWTSAYPQGFMMKASATAGSGGTQTSGQGVDADQSYDWSCSATGADASLFVKPANIQFIDAEAMMGGAGTVPRVPSY